LLPQRHKGTKVYFNCCHKATKARRFILIVATKTQRHEDLFLIVATKPQRHEGLFLIVATKTLRHKYIFYLLPRSHDVILTALCFSVFVAIVGFFLILQKFSHMTDSHINNPKSPKYHIKRWLDSHAEELAGKIAMDLPAGNGVTSEILKNNGAEVFAFDLFPEYFRPQNIECRRADIMSGIPIADGKVDIAICQEGIEHFSDHLKALKEFNRILKNSGKLVITTPSYSNLSARFSYLLFESETNKQMPPNEIDDIWMEDKSVSEEIYHGHIFLIGLQKLRIIAKLAGFKIAEIKYIRISK